MKFVVFLLIIFSFSVIANPLPDDEEELVTFLVERGVICDNQSYDEKLKSLQVYLANRFNKTTSKNNNTKETIHDRLKNKQCISAPKD
ncbi:hypothetical protein [Vibrio hepatarius]|uniref:hypothetical protein n=1 Tax=Vibrio hepatarius TaxID=171383 RepID=UPI001C08882F|nr:hypothetical protein [Vibrio hepatarius]MBU2896165.1 hypothetical protein [Vibrio hepatarius]